MEVNRVLTLTHLRKAEPRNLLNCTRLWRLRDPAFAGGNPFSRKLSLVEEGGHLPDAPQLQSAEDRAYSFSGALDDRTPTHLMDQHGIENIPASLRGFTDPGNNTFIMGGGNLDFCLHQTFASLVRIKLEQGEAINALIPLGMIYYSDKVNNPIDYARADNHYSRWLENIVPNYRITVDGVTRQEKTGPGPRINLHWFIALKEMFASPFFPEITTKSSLDRVMEHFRLRP